MWEASRVSRDFLEWTLPDSDWRARCDRCTVIVVIPETNLFRRAWSIVLAVLLIYTGTVFPFWLCFMEFKIPEPVTPSKAWEALEWAVDMLFWGDLVVNFFFSYRDKGNNEITSFRKIVWNYMTGFFMLNLIACLPENAVTFCVGQFSGSGEEAPGINQATRMARLQRISRLTRLGRLTRLAKMAQFISSSPVMRWLRGLRGMRITNFIVGLLWVVHLIACGWYLCASLHTDPEETWVARRAVDTNGMVSLLEKGSIEQWCHAVYFVLTVFTTVGFGDMSATTTGEIVYVCFTMILGAVINSIIVSEVINIVTSVDREQMYRTKQKELIAAFSTHTELDLDTRIDLEKWIDNQSIYMDYDEEGVKRLLTNGSLPRKLATNLPSKLFTGKLLRNNFVRICKQQVRQLPPRFPVLMALKVYQRHFNAGEYVYHYSDQPYHVFLVMKGTFADVGMPGRYGGVNVVHSITGGCEESMPSYFNFPTWYSTLTDIAAKVGLSTNRIEKNGRNCKRQDTDDMFLGPRPSLHHALESYPIMTSSNGVTQCPYLLHSAESFFGDVELLENKPRRSSVRCEKFDSALLVLHKSDLVMLIDEFPHFGRAWKASARRHERRQTSALESCTLDDHSRSCGDLAATQIARMYRLWKCEGGLSRCAKRSVVLDDIGSESSAECNEVEGNRGTPKPNAQYTPLSGFVSSLALQAYSQSSAPFGVNSNGEVFTAETEAHDRKCNAERLVHMQEPALHERQSGAEMAMIHKSIAAMGNQIREEMHSSVAELRSSVDDLRRWLAPASVYHRRSGGFTSDRQRKSQEGRDSQRRRGKARTSIHPAQAASVTTSPRRISPEISADVASARKELSKVSVSIRL
mmetsp:Transcript_124430/g.229251  ORF Transcript_124430/g.229251 Transcript_124430/m.229251 type:complete len:861 (+) Transcript_124430:106-2688(+)